MTDLSKIGLDSDQQAAVDGVIAEYASKLHLLQQEYDKLKMQSELNYEVLVSEYEALKEKSEKMAAENESLKKLLDVYKDDYDNLHS